MREQIRELFEKLNLQNQVEVIKCLDEVTSEEIRQQLKDENYFFPCTKAVWEENYPTIPAKYIYCQPSIAIPGDLMYMDLEHYILFRLMIWNEEAVTKDPENNVKMITKQLARLMKAYEEKNYYSLLAPTMSEQSGNITLYLLSQMLKREEPNEKLYSTFISTYTIVDHGTKKLDEESIKKLIDSKSDAQKKETLDKLKDFPDPMYVYRGMGSLSTPAEEALSWTTDLNFAYYFASAKGAEKSRVACGKVYKKDILEYIKGPESEVMVYPSTVKRIKFNDLISETEFLDIIAPARNVINEKWNLIKHLYQEYAATANEHDEEHSMRVIMYCIYLFLTNWDQRSGINDMKRDAKYMEDLLDAASYHDIGRTNDCIDETHGISGYKIYRMKKGDNPVVQFLIENHCIDDKQAKGKLHSLFKGKDREAVWNLYEILKDSDALDRVRFGRGSDGVDIKFLRKNNAKLLMGVAETMQSYAC